MTADKKCSHAPSEWPCNLGKTGAEGSRNSCLAEHPQLKPHAGHCTYAVLLSGPAFAQHSTILNTWQGFPQKSPYKGGSLPLFGFLTVCPIAGNSFVSFLLNSKALFRKACLPQMTLAKVHFEYVQRDLMEYGGKEASISPHLANVLGGLSSWGCVRCQDWWAWKIPLRK
jgi:hypothetical protein